MTLSNKTYDTIKLIALVATPVLAFLASLVTIWCPDSDLATKLCVTFTAIDTLLGAIVVALKAAYERQGGANEA